MSRKRKLRNSSAPNSDMNTFILTEPPTSEKHKTKKKLMCNKRIKTTQSKRKEQSSLLSSSSIMSTPLFKLSLKQKTQRKYTSKKQCVKRVVIPQPILPTPKQTHTITMTTSKTQTNNYKTIIKPIDTKITTKQNRLKRSYKRKLSYTATNGLVSFFYFFFPDCIGWKNYL